MAGPGLTIDTKQLPKRLRKLAKQIHTLGKTNKTNPVLQVMATDYKKELRKGLRSRPKVGQSGSVHGKTWPAHKPMYTRKTDGKTAHVWGGLNRLRTGRVTRAGSASIRQGRGLGSFATVSVGQTFTGAKTLGRLKRDGTRYKRSDKQGGAKIRAQSMIGSFLGGRVVLRKRNTHAILASASKHAAAVAKLRPFHWGPKMETRMRRLLRVRAAQFLKRMIRRM